MSRGRTALAVLVVFGALALAAWWIWEGTRAAPDLSRWDDLLDRASRENGLDPGLLRALVAAESGGDPRAVSRAGAIGLCQLMPATAREQAQRLGIEGYDPTRLTEPALNVRLGAAYLARMLGRFDGEVAFAVAAYNAGPSRVVRWRAQAPDASPQEVIEREGFAETRHYLRRVLRLRETYARRARAP